MLKWNDNQSLSAKNEIQASNSFMPKFDPVNHVNVQLVARRLVLRTTTKRPIMILRIPPGIQNPICMFSLKSQSTIKFKIS